MKTLPAVIAQQRPACPFYGFYEADGSMVDSGGNQCALIADRHSPCKMEGEGTEVNWSECPYFNAPGNRKDLSKMMDSFRVFPSEFQPKDKPWEGIPFRNWFLYIMPPSRENTSGE